MNCLTGLIKNHFLHQIKNLFCLYHLVNDSSKILKIERHKYNLKMNDKILDNKELIKLIDDFKWKLC